MILSLSLWTITGPLTFDLLSCLCLCVKQLFTFTVSSLVKSNFSRHFLGAAGTFSCCWNRSINTGSIDVISSGGCDPQQLNWRPLVPRFFFFGFFWILARSCNNCSSSPTSVYTNRSNKDALQHVSDRAKLWSLKKKKILASDQSPCRNLRSSAPG